MIIDGILGDMSLKKTAEFENQLMNITGQEIATDTKKRLFIPGTGLTGVINTTKTRRMSNDMPYVY